MKRSFAIRRLSENLLLNVHALPVTAQADCLLALCFVAKGSKDRALERRCCQMVHSILSKSDKANSVLDNLFPLVWIVAQLFGAEEGVTESLAAHLRESWRNQSTITLRPDAQKIGEAIRLLSLCKLFNALTKEELQTTLQEIAEALNVYIRLLQPHLLRYSDTSLLLNYLRTYHLCCVGHSPEGVMHLLRINIERGRLVLTPAQAYYCYHEWLDSIPFTIFQPSSFEVKELYNAGETMDWLLQHFAFHIFDTPTDVEHSVFSEEYLDEKQLCSRVPSGIARYSLSNGLPKIVLTLTLLHYREVLGQEKEFPNFLQWLLMQ